MKITKNSIVQMHTDSLYSKEFNKEKLDLTTLIPERDYLRGGIK